MRYWLAVLALIAVAPARGNSFYFTDFNNGLDTAALTAQFTPGFNIEVSAGVANFTKTAGTGNSYGQILTNFTVAGDFTATADATRTDLSGAGQFGLAAYFSDDFADAFFFDSTLVAGNVFPNAAANSPLSDLHVSFRIRRTGTTFFSEYDNGQGFVTITTGVGTADPAVIAVFLSQEGSFTSGNSAFADNFAINGESFSSPAPEPASALLLVLPLCLGAFRMHRRQRR